MAETTIWRMRTVQTPVISARRPEKGWGDEWVVEIVVWDEVQNRAAATLSRDEAETFRAALAEILDA